MTGRDRVVAAYKGEFADCVPAYPIAGSFAGCLDGLSIEEYCTNPKKAVKAMLNYYERYQPDIMIAFNDLAKEAEALGCRVKYSDYVVPSIDRHVLQDDKGLLARLEVPDPHRDGRLPAFLEQCEALSAAKFPSGLGAVLVGPWTIAMLLRNPEIMCLDTIDDPEFVHDLMRFSTEYAKRFGDAVLKTKIGLSYTDPTASCSLVGPDTYREFIKPYHQDMVNYFKAKKVGTTVHICGTTHQIHEDLVDVGFVAITIDLDQQSDPKLQVDQLDKLVTLGNQRGVVGIGNVDVTIFERATRARDRGRGEALHRHRRQAVPVRALDLVRAAAAGQPRLREVVHGRGAGVRPGRAHPGGLSRRPQGAGRGRSCRPAVRRTSTAEVQNRRAIAAPATMSGQGDPVTATPPAAASTPALATTSLREHSQADRMLRSSSRRRHRHARTTPLAASASTPTPDMTAGGRHHAPDELQRDLGEDPDPERGHDAALEQGAAGLPLSAASDDVQAEAVHDGVAEHVDGVGEQGGGVGQQAGPRAPRRTWRR